MDHQVGDILLGPTRVLGQIIKINEKVIYVVKWMTSHEDDLGGYFYKDITKFKKNLSWYLEKKDGTPCR